MTENQLIEAVEVYFSPNETKSMRQIAKEFGVSYSTFYGRVHGANPRSEAYENHKALSNNQEQMLEGHLIYLAQNKTPLTRMETRILAGKLKYGSFSPENSKPLSNNWLLGFVSRCKYINLSKAKHVDIPRVRENGDKLILLFFELYTYYINTFNILPDDIWNLDEAGFKIGESTEGLQFLVPDKAPHVISHDSSELITALEMISKTGKVGKPLLIYRGVHQMVNWFPGTVNEQFDNATSPTEFINEPLFYEWVSEHFPSSEDKWSLLLMDGHLSHTSDRVMDVMVNKKIIPLYFPSHMTNILQPLDRSCFGHAKFLFRRQISNNFVAGLNPTKAHFLEAYMKIRNQAYSPKTIIGGWKRCGLLEKTPEIALAEYRRQMHHDIAMPQVSAQEDSVIKAKVGEILTLENSKTLITRKRDPKITREQFLLKRIIELEKKNRKLQFGLKQAQRLANDTMTSKQIIEIQATRLQNELEEEKRKHSRKRSRIPQPNKKLVLSHTGHPLAQNTAPTPLSDQTTVSK